MKYKKKAWGLYTGDKPIALFYKGLVISSKYGCFLCDARTSPTAISRILKAKTRVEHDMVVIDPDGFVSIEDYNVQKLLNLLEEAL